eukprot:2359148-Rhodomonas_salina.4
MPVSTARGSSIRYACTDSTGTAQDTLSQYWTPPAYAMSVPPAYAMSVPDMTLSVRGKHLSPPLHPHLRAPPYAISVPHIA